MYKKIFLVATVLTITTSSAFSAPRHVNLKAKAKRLAQRVNRMVLENADYLSRTELKKIVKSLRRVKGVINGENSGGSGGGDSWSQTCQESSNMYPSEYQDTFADIKRMAYAGDGLNMTSYNATQFTKNWVNKYPCSYAPDYISNMKRLNSFAYGSQGLNMTSYNAEQYAIQNIDKVCVDVDFERIYKKHYQFAYESNGLGLSSYKATQYAKKKTEPIMLSCSNSPL